METRAGPGRVSSGGEGCRMAPFQVSSEEQSHVLGWRLPEDSEDSVIDIHWSMVTLRPIK